MRTNVDSTVSYDPSLRTVYVLRCRGDKYYVGETGYADPRVCFAGHWLGESHVWTRIHRPVEVHAMYRGGVDVKKAVIKHYVETYGSDAVLRGNPIDPASTRRTPRKRHLVTDDDLSERLLPELPSAREIELTPSGLQLRVREGKLTDEQYESIRERLGEEAEALGRKVHADSLGDSVIFALRCEGYKFFVGRAAARDATKAMARHFQGRGCPWTQLFPPQSVDAMLTGDAAVLQDVVHTYAVDRGWANVRGGSWNKVCIAGKPHSLRPSSKYLDLPGDTSITPLPAREELLRVSLPPGPRPRVDELRKRYDNWLLTVRPAIRRMMAPLPQPEGKKPAASA